MNHTHHHQSALPPPVHAVATPRDVTRRFANGEVFAFDAGDCLLRADPFLSQFRLEHLMRNHPTLMVNTTKSQATVAKDGSRFSPSYMKEVADIPPQVSIQAIVKTLDELDRVTVDADYTGKHFDGRPALFKAYGLFNVNRACQRRCEYYHKPKLFQPWGLCLSFVWVGLSSGGMHFDRFDNVLLQLTGKKQMLIYPPHLTDLISGDQYYKHFVSHLSEESRRENAWIDKLPYYLKVLEPADAIAVPSGAYHCPLGLTKDSVSINFFLVPTVCGSPAPSAYGKPMAYPKAVWRMLYVAFVHKCLGVKLVQNSLYDLD